jgi:two-component system, OmpR family, response regulator VicR
MKKILLVEDNYAITMGLKYLLESNNFEFNNVSLIKEAKEILLLNNFDLIILDITLPDGDGFSLCKYIKEKYNIPIIILTAKDEEKDVVMGFDLGADDYVIKPFRNQELLSRINYFFKNNNSNVINIKSLKIDTLGRRVYVNDKEILLTSLEYNLLLYLCENSNQVITREQIFDRIWDQNDNYVNDNTLTVYIKRIREKLGIDIIKTIKGIGYRVDK